MIGKDVFKMLNTTKSILVGYDFSNGKDKSVLIVGQKRPNESIDIINAFQGEEANHIWNILTKKENE